MQQLVEQLARHHLLVLVHLGVQPGLVLHAEQPGLHVVVDERLLPLARVLDVAARHAPILAEVRLSEDTALRVVTG